MRFDSLHALRGLAAFSVVIYHLFLTFPAAIVPIDIFDSASWGRLETWLRYTPLRAPLNGRSAVILFFVLSGFVLAKSVESTKDNYGRYAFRRICRIYIPFLASIIFAAALFACSKGGPTTGLSAWFNEKSWLEPLSSDVVIRHLFMTGRSQDMHLNNVMWSLVHELRLSLIFPGIVLLMVPNFRIALAAFLAVWLLAAGLGQAVPEGTVLESMVDTSGYAVFFTFGAACYLQREKLIAAFRPMNTLVTLGLSILLMSVPAGVPAAEILYGVASVALIGLALAKPRVEEALKFRPNLWLGEVSYSLYLCHLPILLFAFNQFYGIVGSGWIAVGVVLVSLVVAQLMYWVVERPAMTIGKIGRRRVHTSGQL